MATQMELKALGSNAAGLLLTAAVTLSSVSLGCAQEHAVQRDYSQEEIAQLFRAHEAAAVVASHVVENLDNLSPRDLEMLVTLVVESNPVIYGSAIAFEPRLYTVGADQLAEGVSQQNSADMTSFITRQDDPDGLPIYCPYAHRTADGVAINTYDLAGVYDYTNYKSPSEWYIDPKRLFLRGYSLANESCRKEDRVFTRAFDNSTFGPCFWSDVYFDEGAGNISMATFSAPFRTTNNMSYLGEIYDGVPSKPDADGKWFGGVVTVDVSLKHIGSRACPAELCSACPAGKQLSSEETDCTPCTGNTYSTYGMCVPCKGVAEADRTSGLQTQCAQCEAGKQYGERDAECVCQHGHFAVNILGQVPTCEDCDDTVMTCPGGGHIMVDAVSGTDHSPTGVLPQPGYWLDPASVGSMLQDGGKARLDQVMKNLWCDNEVCLGTTLDRDWRLTPSNEYNFVGYCAGDKLLDDVKDSCKSTTRNASNGTGCPQPPDFCRAGHTGRLCSACVSGAKMQAGGRCCFDRDYDEHALTLGEVALVPFWLLSLVLLTAYVIQRNLKVEASDSTFASMVFFFQMMYYVGQDNNWLVGIPLLRQGVGLLASAMSFQPDVAALTLGVADVCEEVSCPVTYYGTSIAVLGNTVFKPLALLMLTYGIVHSKAFDAVTYFKRDDQGNPITSSMTKSDLWPMFVRSAFALYRSTTMPMMMSAITVLVPFCYSTEPDKCEDLPYSSAFQPSFDWVFNGTTDVTTDPVWLLKADPSIVFLGSASHCVAVAWALLTLCCHLAALPIIRRGINREKTKIDTVRRLTRSLSDAVITMRESIDLEANKSVDGNAAKVVRNHFLQQKQNKFTPFYGEYNEGVRNWWFMVDLLKKLLISLAFTFGENMPESLWKPYVFFIIGAYVVLHSVFDPCPTLATNFFESFTSICVMLMLYMTSIPEFKDNLQNLLAALLITIVVMLGCVKFDAKEKALTALEVINLYATDHDGVLDEREVAAMNQTRRYSKMDLESKTQLQRRYSNLAGTDADESVEAGSLGGPSIDDTRQVRCHSCTIVHSHCVYSAGLRDR